LIHDRFSFATNHGVERQGGRVQLVVGNPVFKNRASLGAILPDSGRIHEFVFPDAPTDYVWQGARWPVLQISKERGSKRSGVSFRLIGLPRPTHIRFLRLNTGAEGNFRLSGKLNFHKRSARETFVSRLIIG